MKQIFTIILALLSLGVAQAKYVDRIGDFKTEIDLTKEFGLKSDNAASDQSALVQGAIDKTAKAGGGVLYIPSGTYSFSGIDMDSNIHILIDKGVVIKPFIFDSQSNNYLFSLTGRTTGKSKSKEADEFIENCSIRCKQSGEYFIIDYSHLPSNCNFRRITRSARAFKCCLVRNFMIEGIYVKDNWTTHCAGIFVPSKVDGCDKWEVFRPTAGLIRNFKSTNSSTGYGLAQLHGGYDLHFENLSTTNGGITFRLETGAGGYYGGIDKISANKIYCENGISPMIMGPHTAQNGTVHASNLTAVSCTSAFQCGPGYNDGRENHNTPGRFADDSTIENIHAIYGNNAPVSKKRVGTAYTHEQMMKFTFDKHSGNFRGASINVAIDTSGDSWSPIIKNVTAEGFPKKQQLIVTKEKDERSNYVEILSKYPVWDEVPDYVKSPTKKDKSKKKK